MPDFHHLRLAVSRTRAYSSLARHNICSIASILSSRADCNSNFFAAARNDMQGVFFTSLVPPRCCRRALWRALRCQSGGSYEPFASDAFPVGMAGSGIFCVGIERMSIVLHLIPIGVGDDTESTRQGCGTAGGTGTGENQWWPDAGT